MEKERQNEVTNHLRCAIKKKLSEISDFVDDELPEYIMILVANQRSKSQIEKDLSLFLRNDTTSFTNWLWSLLNNINISSKGSNLSTKSDSGFPKKDSDIDEDAIVLGYDPDEHENELLSHEDTNDSVINKGSTRPTSCEIKEEMKGTLVLKAQPVEVLENVKKEKVTERKSTKSSISSETKPIKSQSKRNSKEQLCSKVVSVKRRYITNSDDEYDPSKPELVKSNSLRNHSGSTAFQPNKLLLKAVDDATKSVLVGQNIEDFYKPTPIKVLTSRLRRSSSVKQDVDSGSDENQSAIALNSDILSQNAHKIGQQYSDVDFRDLYSPISLNKSRTICLNNEPSMSDSPDSRFLDLDSQIPSEYSEIEEYQPKSPHFIVTMEGINLNSFKRKLEDNSVDSIEDEEMETDEMTEDISPSKKVKVSERCKYWPACKNSNDCFYHHPTTPCKCFPDCKYGDKCLYIHPNCKFDALCSRKDCPFTHASKRKLPLTSLPVKVAPVKPHRAKIVCKYFPKCTMRNCPFIHPKLCRYGTECRLPSCMFSHLPIPSRSQLKWQAPDL